MKDKPITPKQKEQFNRMLYTLKRIAKHYQTPAKMRKNSEKDFGLEYEEALEHAYENIQNEADLTIKGIRELQ